MIGRIATLGLCVLALAHSWPANAQPGVVVMEHELHQRPPFYKGSMPLRYRSGERMLGMGMDIVYWHEFAGWKNSFAYSSVLVLESAKAERSSGELLAEATFIKLDKDARRIVLRERHYTTGGTISFECVSSYSIGLGFKLEESEAKGEKEREFFFILPV